MTQKVYDPGDKHPPEYQRDMNPDAAGVNFGTVGHHPHRMANDVKEAHRLLDGFTDDVLKQIPILVDGTRLEQDATYLDLTDHREFTATSGMEAGPGQLIVPKSEVD